MAYVHWIAIAFNMQHLAVWFSCCILNYYVSIYVLWCYYGSYLQIKSPDCLFSYPQSHQFLKKENRSRNWTCKIFHDIFIHWIQRCSSLGMYLLAFHYSFIIHLSFTCHSSIIHQSLTCHSPVTHVSLTWSFYLSLSCHLPITHLPFPSTSLVTHLPMTQLPFPCNSLNIRLAFTCNLLSFTHQSSINHLSLTWSITHLSCIYHSSTSHLCLTYHFPSNLAPPPSPTIPLFLTSHAPSIPL